MKRATLLFLIALAGCGLEADPAGGAAAVEAGSMDEAFARCTGGDLEDGIAALDATVRETDGAPDPLVLRGLCYWTRWDQSGDASDAEQAYSDLSSAITAIEDGASAAMPLDRVYSHRAFVAQALDGGWERTVEDLGRATELAPDNATHAIDYGVARALVQDTAGARREFRRFLSLTDDSTDAERRDLAESLLDDLEDGSAE